MREHLLGYLIGALEPTEQALVGAELEQDHQLRRECVLLRGSLVPLSGDDHFDPPEALALRTCRMIAEHSQPTAYVGGFGGSTGWRLTDVLVAAGILVAGTLLLFPAITNSRFHSRLDGCRDNLRQLGHALASYSDRQDGRFPVVPTRGKLAAAGMYAPTLVEQRLISDPRVFVCPASPLAEGGNFDVPTMAELDAATPELLQELQRRMGGSYAYSLGYLDNGELHGVGQRRRETFAVMADTPALNVPGQANSSNHGCCGQNVLFEDGHVGFLKQCRTPDSDDDIFKNTRGQVLPGIGPDDAVVAPSDAAPTVGEE